MFSIISSGVHGPEHIGLIWDNQLFCVGERQGYTTELILVTTCQQSKKYKLHYNMTTQLGKEIDT